MNGFGFYAKKSEFPGRPGRFRYVVNAFFRINHTIEEITNLFPLCWERGRVEIKEHILKLICSEFSANEDWLRTGAGEKNQTISFNLVD